MFSLTSCITTSIEWVLTSLVVIVSSFISSILEVITMSYVITQLEDKEEDPSYQRLLLGYTTTFIAVVCTRTIRNIAYIVSQRGLVLRISLVIWVSVCLVNIGSGILAFALLDKPATSIIFFVLIYFTILVMSHFIDLVVIGIKLDPRQRPLWLLLAKRTRLSHREECFICADEYTHSIELECGHSVHEECLERWAIQGHQNCPVCRSEIV